MMIGDLYGIATNVIVFLSEESDDSDLAIDFAENITRLLQNLPTDYHVRISDFDELNLPPPDDFCWMALRLLLIRPWFYRKWIIQQFASARAVTMVCSSRIFPSNLLENLFTESIKHWLASITTPDGASSLLMNLNHPFSSILLEMSLRSRIGFIELCLYCSQWDVVPHIYSVSDALLPSS
jgi:hypothetical protein